MRLKHQIRRRAYRVDAEAVAREIVSKLRMISLGRRALLAEASLLAEAPKGGGRQVPPTSE